MPCLKTKVCAAQCCFYSIHSYLLLRIPFAKDTQTQKNSNEEYTNVPVFMLSVLPDSATHNTRLIYMFNECVFVCVCVLAWYVVCMCMSECVCVHVVCLRDYVLRDTRYIMFKVVVFVLYLTRQGLRTCLNVCACAFFCSTYNIHTWSAVC